MLNRNFLQVDAIETTNINCRRRIAFRIDTFAKRMNAAGRAKAMLDDMLVERVGGRIVFGRKQAHLIARHKPQSEPFRRHMEQLHAIAPVSSPSTSRDILPQ